MRKLNGVKRAVGEAKKWEAQRFGYVANIMLDKETGEVWCDTFTSCNEWKNYHEDSIVSVTAQMNFTMADYDDLKINMKNVNRAAEELLNQ